MKSIYLIVISILVISTSAFSLYIPDSDNDGLSDIEDDYPTDSDYDDDGFLDGVEKINIAIGDQNNPLDPSTGNQLWDYDRTTTYIISKDSSRNYFASAWNPRRILKKEIAAITTDTTGSFTNPQLVVIDISNPSYSLKTVDTTTFPLPSLYKLNGIDWDPLGVGIIYDNGHNLFWSPVQPITLTGLTARQLTFYSDVTIKNPAVARIGYGNYYLLASYKKGNESNISAFPLTIGMDDPFVLNLDTANRINIADITNPTYIGDEEYIRVSRDGDRGEFNSKTSDIRSSVFAFMDLKNILSGITTSVDYGDPRLVHVAAGSLDDYDIPVGFGGTNNIVYVSTDRSATFNRSNPNFSTTDFDLFLSTLSIDTYAPGAYQLKQGIITQTPKVNDQVLGNVSPDGSKIIYSDDNSDKDNFSLNIGAIRSAIARPNSGQWTGPYSLFDPSGNELIFIDTSSTERPVGYLGNAITARTDLEDSLDGGTFRFWSKQIYEPSSTSFSYDSVFGTETVNIGAIRIWNYFDIDLEDDDGNIVIDENSIVPYEIIGNNTTMIDTTGYFIRVPSLNKIFTKQLHFSEYILGGFISTKASLIDYDRDMIEPSTRLQPRVKGLKYMKP